MGAPNEDNIKEIKGELILSPSDLADAPAYGGTRLGNVSAFFWVPGQRTVRVRAKEKGRTAAIIHIDDDLTAGFILREQSDDVFDFVFPGTTVGSSSGNKVVNLPSQTSGTELTGSVLLFAAKRDTEMYSLLIYNAVVEFDATSRIRFSTLRETSVPVIVTGLEDGSGRVAKWGLLEDLSL